MEDIIESKRVATFILEILNDIIDDATDPQLNDEIKNELRIELDDDNNPNEEIKLKPDSMILTDTSRIPVTASPRLQDSEIQSIDSRNIQITTITEVQQKDEISPIKYQKQPNENSLNSHPSLNSGQRDSSDDRYGKTNEENFSYFSENEICGLITPMKKIGSPNESLFANNMNEVNKNQCGTIHEHNPAEDSNDSQNNLVYGSGKHIPYSVNKGPSITQNDGSSSYKPAPISQYQTCWINTTINKMVGSNFQNAYGTLQANRLATNLPRRNFGVYGQQYSVQQNLPGNITPSEGLITHYSKIIDELKDENRRTKENFESTIKQKDFYMKSLLEEHKKIIEEKNKFIESQNALIAQLVQRNSISWPPMREEQPPAFSKINESFSFVRNSTVAKDSNRTPNLLKDQANLNFRNQSFRAPSKIGFKMATKSKADQEVRKLEKEHLNIKRVTVEEQNHMKPTTPQDFSSVNIESTTKEKSIEDPATTGFKNFSTAFGAADGGDFAGGFKLAKGGTFAVKDPKSTSRFESFMSKLQEDLEDDNIAHSFGLDIDKVKTAKMEAEYEEPKVPLDTGLLDLNLSPVKNEPYCDQEMADPDDVDLNESLITQGDASNKAPIESHFENITIEQPSENLRHLDQLMEDALSFQESNDDGSKKIFNIAKCFGESLQNRAQEIPIEDI